MIHLNLEAEEYCENCPEFMPVVTNTLDFYNINIRDFHMRDITVGCTHRDYCRNIFEYLKKTLSEE